MFVYNDVSTTDIRQTSLNDNNNGLSLVELTKPDIQINHLINLGDRGPSHPERIHNTGQNTVFKGSSYLQLPTGDIQIPHMCLIFLYFSPFKCYNNFFWNC